MCVPAYVTLTLNILTLKAQDPPSAAETPSIANTMLIGMVASVIVLN